MKPTEIVFKLAFDPTPSYLGLPKLDAAAKKRHKTIGEIDKNQYSQRLGELFKEAHEDIENNIQTEIIPISEVDTRELYDRHKDHVHPCCSCAESIGILREEVKALQKGQVSIKQDIREVLAVVRSGRY